ncbi:MAG: uracil-DNA glycosylase [Cellulosilyticaceae bacterium]
MITFNNSWDAHLASEFEKPYYLDLRQFLKEAYSTQVIFPNMSHIFEAFKLTSYEDTKVVILGQDPYQTPGFAHGLAFSVNPGVDTPRSLQNIFKELHTDLGCIIPNNGNLISWANQGILLLNTCLTVVSGISNSHKGKGWEIFTDHVITCLNAKETPVVFILWGNNARSKKSLLTNPKHLILESAHPSPLSASRGFFGSQPFSKTNDFLIASSQTPINWQIPNL